MISLLVIKPERGVNTCEKLEMYKNNSLVLPSEVAEKNNINESSNIPKLLSNINIIL